ncbi:hypothetical protein [Moorella sulfitireducens (nom. illeg.)]|uniref:hypothetical protein n=1 Tax=Neomoorella sulfitireducens TaxID=2972948 RepID=UPI0021ACDAF6|nr:hypothetical protein [Moorella sulfitireducens]
MAGEEIRVLCSEPRRLGYYEFQIKEIIPALPATKRLTSCLWKTRRKLKPAWSNRSILPANACRYDVEHFA